MKIISFEGGIGAGKTSLTNYFSKVMKVEKILENYSIVPFLKEFYENPKNGPILEIELSFLLIHYNQIKKTIENSDRDSIIFADFTIEKDYVYAKMNLSNDEFEVFSRTYDYFINKIGLPEHVIYIDISEKILRRRIFQRGREFEMNADPQYFIKFNENVKQYFNKESKSTVHLFDVSDLELDPNNKKLCLIEGCIMDIIRNN